MILALFIIGALTSLGCGANVVGSRSDGWKTEAVWMLGGCIGAGLMVLAILLSRGWPA
jgi:hypothetical protein